MFKNEEGFTLVELMITMVIFVLVIAASSQIFVGLLTQFKQQSKIAESNIEGIVGLEILRHDMADAGYGLPWNMSGAAYSEAVADGATPYDDATFNDSTGGNPPRAVAGGNGAGYLGSDVLVIKATNVGTSETVQRWTYITNTGDLPNVIKQWDVANDNLASTDRIIVVNPRSGTERVLLTNAVPDFYTTRGGSANSLPDAAFEPGARTIDTYVAYGIVAEGTPRMPFNRADYYIKRPSSGMPGRCAVITGTDPDTGIGIFYKGTINNSTGNADSGKHLELPLLDCAADMQVVYGLDMDDDGIMGTFSDGATTVEDAIETEVSAGTTLADVQATLANAQNLRNRLKEIRLFILAHEGQIDRNYTHPSNTITVGGTAGRVFNFNDPNNDGDASDAITNWQNYRWKIYTLVVQPNNLR